MSKDIVEWETHFSSKEEAVLRTRLIALQNKIREANVPVYIVLCGVSGAGKFGTMFLLRDWMDQRSVRMNAYEREDFSNMCQEYMRYWNDNVLNGEIGVFLRSWYSEPLVKRSTGKIDDKAFYKKLDWCKSLEKTLTDNGAVFCKIWFYKSKKEQEAYLHTLEDMPYERWRIMESDWKNCALADDFEKTSKKIVEYTDAPEAPWFAVKKGTYTERVRDGLDIICSYVEKQVEKRVDERKKNVNEDTKPSKKVEFAKKLDLTASLSKDKYEQLLPYYRTRLNACLTEVKRQNKKLILAFEGPDASGKGGVISRISSALHIMQFRIFPIAAPTKEELNHHFLWRFFKRLTGQKLMTVFDRTWYGRVLVERIEHFATDKEWKQAFDEINTFEKLLTDGGNIVVKFLLYIDRDEQFKRFKAREETAYKMWKIGEEDWRNRDKWDLYDTAYQEMLDKTDTKTAPWFVVPDNSKKFGRIEAMRLLCEHLEKVLDFKNPTEPPVLKEKKKKDKDADGDADAAKALIEEAD